MFLSCANKKQPEIKDNSDSSINFDLAEVKQTFGEFTPIPVSKHDMDSILSTLTSGNSFIFTDLYPITDTLPTRIDDTTFILADKLENLGYTHITGGGGNYPNGPRITHILYKKDSIECNIYKAYQYYQLQEDSTYNMLVFEQLECIKNE